MTSINDLVAEALSEMNSTPNLEGPKPRRGPDIFPDPSDPRLFSGIVGQRLARNMLVAAVRQSTRTLGGRLPHILLAFGAPGVAKSSLARITAYEAGAGVTELSGAVSVEEAQAALVNMHQGDALILDEVHMLFTGGKAKGEWLLHLLETGSIVTPKGRKPMPDVSVIATTTDTSRVPDPILTRFRVKPVLVDLSSEDMVGITRSFAQRADLTLSNETLHRVADAACYSPRQARAILDVVTMFDGDVSLALETMALTDDGLDSRAQDYLKALGILCRGKASVATLSAMLAEPTLSHIERGLLRLNLIEIAPSGRLLTKRGQRRLTELLETDHND